MPSLPLFLPLIFTFRVGLTDIDQLWLTVLNA